MTDVDALRKVLQRLVDKGNTVVVIEHNLDLIRTADYVIEIGPGPGDKGGELLFQGSPTALSKRKTPTSRFLKTATKMKQAI
ncbi:UNVERIFIED_CONTAM: hypothetical protein GTU68_046859 [Idotea baltica]|nr:hypothetical protein [Idotea baltica]